MKVSGFTLIEVLLAMVIFTLIIAVTYGALGPASIGFVQLQEHRDRLEKQHWASWQLRQDMSYIVASQDANLKPLRFSYDARGDASFDELWILVRELGQPSLSMVHYFLDEESGMLVREYLMPWSREGVEPTRWELGKMDSFDVEVLAEGDRWLQNWGQTDNLNAVFAWPKAVRITTRNAKGEQIWYYPLMMGQP